MKIVIIGAGSVSFGRGQIADLLQAGELKGRGGTLCLVDINPQALREATRTGRPCSGLEFVRELEVRLERVLTPQKRGRKPKSTILEPVESDCAPELPGLF